MTIVDPSDLLPIGTLVNFRAQTEGPKYLAVVREYDLEDPLLPYMLTVVPGTDLYTFQRDPNDGEQLCYWARQDRIELADQRTWVPVDWHLYVTRQADSLAQARELAEAHRVFCEHGHAVGPDDSLPWDDKLHVLPAEEEEEEGNLPDPSADMYADCLYTVYPLSSEYSPPKSLEQFSEDLLLDVVEILPSKGADYAGVDTPLWNLEFAAEVVALAQEHEISTKDQIMLTQVAVKLGRIINLLTQWDVNNESMEDSFKDLIGYLTLWAFKVHRS